MTNLESLTSKLTKEFLLVIWILLRLTKFFNSRTFVIEESIYVNDSLQTDRSLSNLEHKFINLQISLHVLDS